jgi:hypothetical protein
MNKSEEILTKINTGIFFKEFTYHQNEIFRLDGGSFELADNVVLLDELLLVYQIKEREKAVLKSAESEEKWFVRTVAGKAMKQIEHTVGYFETFNSLPVTNGRGQEVDVSGNRPEEAVKLIIYDSNSIYLAEKRNLKFLKSPKIGLVHLFQIADYEKVCRYLITPAELAEYLDFRVKIYNRHGGALNTWSENYLLAHFFTTPEVEHLNKDYLANLAKMDTDIKEFDISWILNTFFEKLLMFDQGRPTDYHYIVREIAKLNRVELKGFSSRYRKMLQNAQDYLFEYPARFTSVRTGCGFVFINILKENNGYWEACLSNCTEMYKYKHKLKKCLGVIAMRKPPYYDIFWAYSSGDWVQDDAMEDLLEVERGIYPESKIEPLPRYPLCNGSLGTSS